MKNVVLPYVSLACWPIMHRFDDKVVLYNVIMHAHYVDVCLCRLKCYIIDVDIIIQDAFCIVLS